MRKNFCILFATVSILVMIAVPSALFAVSSDDIRHELIFRSILEGRNEAYYAEALELYERALKGRETTPGGEHISSIDSAIKLAELYYIATCGDEMQSYEKVSPFEARNEGFYAEALELYERTLKERETTLGGEHSATIASAMALAELYYKAALRDEALETYEKAVSACEKRNEKASALDILLRMAKMTDLPGLNKARFAEIQERVLATLIAINGEASDSVAETLSLLGDCYEELGEYGKARERYERALVIRENIYGMVHPDLKNNYGSVRVDTAKSLDDLGRILRRFREYKKAVEYHERALETREKLLSLAAKALGDFGTNHNNSRDYLKAEKHHERALADTAETLGNLGADYRGIGDYAKASEYHKRALAIQFPEKDSVAVNSLIDLGGDYYLLKNYAEAKKCFAQALAIELEDSNYRWNDERAEIMKFLGGVHWMLGEEGEAEILFKLAGQLPRQDEDSSQKRHELDLAERSEILGEGHVYTALALETLADDYFRSVDEAGWHNELLETTQLLERALDIRLKVFGENNIDTARVHFKLGNCGGIKAMDHHQRALTVRMALLGEEDPDTASSLHGIGALYKEAEPLTALDYHNRALAVRQRRFGEESVETAESYVYLGDVYNRVATGWGPASSGPELYDEETQGELFGDWFDYSNYVHEKALEYYERALSIYLTKLDRSDLRVTKLLADMTYISLLGALVEKNLKYKGLSREIEIEKAYERAIELRARDRSGTTGLLAEIEGSYWMALAKSAENELGEENNRDPWNDVTIALRCYDIARDIFESEFGYDRLETARAAAASAYMAYENNNMNSMRETNFLSILEECEIIVSVCEKLGNGQGAYEAMRVLKIIETGKGGYAYLENESRDMPDVAAAKAGDYFYWQCDYEKALFYHKKSLHLLQNAPVVDDAKIAGILDKMGDDYYALADFTASRQCLEKALDILTKLQDDDGPDTDGLLSKLGKTCLTLGSYEAAKDYHERALSARVKNLEQSAEEDVGGSELSSLSDLRWWEEAGEQDDEVMEYLGRNAAPYREIPVEYGFASLDWARAVAESLRDLGRVYFALGDYTKARKYQNCATAGWMKTGNPEEVGASMIALGSIFDVLGDGAKAEVFYKRAVALQMSGILGFSGGLLDIENSQGKAWLFHHFSEYEKALEQSKHTLLLYRLWFGEERPQTAQALNEHGRIFSALGDYAQAKECHERALLIQIKSLVDNHPDTIVSLNSLGEVYRRQGQNDAAILFLKMAVNVTQSTRSSIVNLDKELQKSFLHSKESYYQTLADLLIEQGRIPEAQQVLGMLKEEELFDFYQRGEKNDQREIRADFSPLEQKQLEQFRKISGQLFARYKEKEELLKKKGALSASEWDSSADAERLKEINAVLEKLTKDLFAFFDSLETELKIEGRDEAQLVAGSKYLEDIQRTLKETEHETALIHTLVTPGHVWLILTTSNNQLHVKSPVLREELNKKIQGFRERLEKPNRGDPKPLARELYDILIAPISKDLQDSKAQTLLFSFDGALRFIPMSALHDGERWLAEKYAVAVYTDAARENLGNGHATGKWETAAAFGVTKAHPPDFIALPAVRAELESIVVKEDGGDADGIFPGTIHLDPNFTESAFAAALGSGAPLIHVATHFKLKPGTIADSFLLLGDGGGLTLKKIHDDDLNFKDVDQLTLSACETAIGFGESAGREMEGMGVLAQKQGAKSVMATLWSIADASTGEFMPSYYGLLQQEGKTKAEALRLAQVEFIKSTAKPTATGKSEKLGTVKGDGDEPTPTFYPGYSHPYYWAPFILMGNWL